MTRLVEVKSKSPEDLAMELESIKADYEDFGPEGFYAVPFSSFEREYPTFSNEIIKTFLRDMEILTPAELKDPAVFAEYWKDGDLITPEDWPALIDGAERLLTFRKDKGIQWEKIYKTHYKPVDEELGDDIEVEDAGMDKDNRFHVYNVKRKEADESLGEDLRSDVYTALSDVAFDHEVMKNDPKDREDFEDAEDNFNAKFFVDGEDLDDSLPESLNDVKKLDSFLGIEDTNESLNEDAGGDTYIFSRKCQLDPDLPDSGGYKVTLEDKEHGISFNIYWYKRSSYAASNADYLKLKCDDPKIRELLFDALSDFEASSNCFTELKKDINSCLPAGSKVKYGPTEVVQNPTIVRYSKSGYRYEYPNPHYTKKNESLNESDGPSTGGYYLVNNSVCKLDFNEMYDYGLENNLLNSKYGIRQVVADFTGAFSADDVSSQILGDFENYLKFNKGVDIGESLTEELKWPNGEKVDNFDLFKALQYMYGTDVVTKESDVKEYTDDQKQKAVNYYAKKVDESLNEEVVELTPEQEAAIKAACDELIANADREVLEYIIEDPYSDDGLFGMDALYDDPVIDELMDEHEGLVFNYIINYLKDYLNK